MNLKKKFKMTKKEKVLSLVLVGILIGYGAYQVAYGMDDSDGQCYLPNEVPYHAYDIKLHKLVNISLPHCSDYKGGFKAGFAAYYECSNQSSCRPTLPEQINTLGGYPPSQTPYAHGYHHGWVKACLNDGGWANCYGWHDGGPVIAAITGPGHCDNTTGCESGNFTSIH